MRRVETEELLDHDIPREERERSLRDLRNFNRFAGGFRAFQMLLRRLIPSPNGAFSILDLGTGTSDLLEGLDGTAFKVGVDFKLEHLVVGAHLSPTEKIHRVAADGFRLPLRSASVDVVGSSHFFHHFSPEENVQMLSEALRVARIGVFVTDTKRHVVPLAFVHALGMARLIGSVTRHDAPASVRQGYVASELRSIASRLPVRRFEVLSIFPFRFGLLLWK